MRKLILLLVLFNPVVAIAEDTAVIYFGNNHYRPSNTDVFKSVSLHWVDINLDAPANVERELSKGLPRDREKAQIIAEQRLNSYSKEQLQAIFLGALLANNRGINKIPAYLFYDNRVVYGVRDAKVAIKIWMRERRHEKR